MLKKSLVSPIALAFGLALTGAVAAQNMIGGRDVSDADWAGVEERCAELVAGVGVEGDVMFDGDTSTGPEDRGTDDNDNSQDSGATPAEPDIEGGFDLTWITIADCEAAGLGEE